MQVVLIWLQYSRSTPVGCRALHPLMSNPGIRQPAACCGVLIALSKRLVFASLRPKGREIYPEKLSGYRFLGGATFEKDRKPVGDVVPAFVQRQHVVGVVDEEGFHLG